MYARRFTMGSYAVMYRRVGKVDWYERGRYCSLREACERARELTEYVQGFEYRLEFCKY